MDRRSKHLSSEERGVIFAEQNRGSSRGAIGRLLGRPASTICRELARVVEQGGSDAASRLPYLRDANVIEAPAELLGGGLEDTD